MRFTSKFAGYQAVVREPVNQWFDDGRHREIRPMIVCDFAEGSEDLTFRGQEGQDEGATYVAMIGGGFFDTEEAQAKHGWTDEEREAAEARLKEIERTDGDVRELVPAVPIPPWPTYDEQHPDHVADRAIELGFAQEALLYEQRTLKRESVLEKLTAYIQENADQSELTAA